MKDNIIVYIYSCISGFLLGLLSILLVIFGFYLWTSDITIEDKKTRYIKPAIFLISGISSCILEFYLLFKLGYLIFS